MPYIIGGRPVQGLQEPKNLNGPIYVPLREMMDQLGGKTTWENTTKTAGATLNGRHARLPTDGSTITVDGQPIGMSVSSIMEGNEFWVPIEFFEKAFGVVATWEASNNTVAVDTSRVRRVA